jgi:23S rRNA (pseudouridine1915-N3)-methyltransferase
VRLRVIAVGRDRKGLFAPAVETYVGRIRRYLPFEVVTVPASRHAEAARARAEEAEKIRRAHGTGRRLICLEVDGEALSSEGLATRLGRLMQEGRDVDLVIGGDEGLDPDLRREAEAAVSLGPMTLPHQLARLVLVEQVYRAMTLLRGEPYHK